MLVRRVPLSADFADEADAVADVDGDASNSLASVLPWSAADVSRGVPRSLTTEGPGEAPKGPWLPPERGDGGKSVGGRGCSEAAVESKTAGTLP